MQEANRGAGATETLARFVTETSYKALPAEVVAAAKIAIFDGIANMLAGSTQPLSAIVVDYLKQIGDPATGLPIGSTLKNLKAAQAGETHEYETMYPGFAKTAREEGFTEIAEWFETLARAERSHAGRFQKGLDTLNK